MNNISIIIRSASERTEQLCKKLIEDQGIDKGAIEIVKEVPFSAAMKRSFEIGIRENRKWTLCIDADILPRPKSVAKMVELSEKQPSKVCEIQGFMMDNLFGGIRKGGFHLYRTSLLPMVIQEIPEEGVNIRPESYTLNKMAEKGYPRSVVPYVVGTHDEEQYNFDIYRKAFVYAVKHLERADLLVTYWKKHVDSQFDYKVALKAFSDSIKYTGQLFINSDQELYKKMFESSGFEEKEELNIDSITLEDIEQRIERWNVDDKYYDHFPTSGGLDSGWDMMRRKLKQSIRNRGYRKTALLIMSQSLTKLGEKIGSRVPE